MIDAATASGRSLTFTSDSVSTHDPSVEKLADVFTPSKVNSASHSFALSLPHFTSDALANFASKALVTFAGGTAAKAAPVRIRILVAIRIIDLMFIFYKPLIH